MIPVKINIPNPQGDSMGASLRSLLDVLEQWSKVTDKKELLIDLSNVLFVHPFFILPLCALCANEKEKGKKLNFQLSENIEPYLNTIHFPHGIDAIATENWEKVLSKFSSKTYLPACKIPAASKHTGIREQLLTVFENILIQQAKLKGQICSIFGKCLIHIHQRVGTNNPLKYFRLEWNPACLTATCKNAR